MYAIPARPDACRAAELGFFSTGIQIPVKKPAVLLTFPTISDKRPPTALAERLARSRL